MKNFLKICYFSILFLLLSCGKIKKVVPEGKNDFTIAFGSCNRQNTENILWEEIIKNKPNLWIWGGDNIYADTHDMNELRADYNALKNQKGYLDLVNNIPVMATWDDHDYGKNEPYLLEVAKTMPSMASTTFSAVSSRSNTEFSTKPLPMHMIRSWSSSPNQMMKPPSSDW